MSTISTLREVGIKSGISLLQNIGITAVYEKKYGALAAEIDGCRKLYFALQCVQHFQEKKWIAPDIVSAHGNIKNYEFQEGNSRRF